MRSIEAVLTFDFARRGGNIFAVTMLAMIGVPLWIYSSLGHSYLLAPNSREGVVMHVTLTLTMGFGAAVAVFQAQGRIARFFSQPISAARLVAIQMTLGIATIAFMYVGTAAILNLRGTGWPLLGPALFLSATLACALAAIWSCEGSVLSQLLGCVATSGPLVIWFSRCYGATLMGDWQVMWQSPSMEESLTLGAIIAGAYVAAVFGVARVRQGDVCDFTALQAWWQRLSTSHHAAPSFRSPLEALRWFEARRTYNFVPAYLIALLLLAMLILRCGGWLDTPMMFELMMTLPLTALTLVLPLIFGILFGNCSHGQVWATMNQGIATRPVTDSLLATTMLSNAAIALLRSWGTWAIVVALVALLAIALGFREELLRALLLPEGSNWTHRLAPVIILPLISWTIAGLMMSLTATGRQWLWSLVLIGGFSALIFFVVIQQYVSPPQFRLLVLGWYAVSGTCYVAGTAWAFVEALRKRVISSGRVIASLAAWLFSVILLAAMPLPPPSEDIAWLIHSVGILALSILPLAALPLAIRWNRHR